MAHTLLSFVLTDRVAELDATCAAAGFDGAGARRFRALYAGPARSEQRVARGVGMRLWLPLMLEPLLTGSRFGFDDEPPTDLGPGSTSHRANRYATRFPAGAATLEIAWRYPGARVAFALKTEHVERIADELLAMLPDQVAVRANEELALYNVELDLRTEHDAPLQQDAVLAFLRERGADRIEHPGGTLLEHLQRTAGTLASWRARPALVVAGLCHAVYGTAGFDRALLGIDCRAALAQLAGVEAEAIAYAYACCDRVTDQLAHACPTLRDRFTGQAVPLGAQLLRDLAELSCANELDVMTHATAPDVATRAAIAAAIAVWQPWLGARAAADVSAALDA